MAYAPDELKQLWHILPSKYALDEILNSMILPLMKNGPMGDIRDRRKFLPYSLYIYPFKN